jgi:hypothetical protein
MEQSITGLIGSFGALFFVVGVTAGLVFAVSYPFLAWSVVLNIRKIARELQRANDYREHYEHGVRPGPLGT